ncbi:PIG-L deacetylase family protein [Tuberibacillus calidus]|jgi:LmbE family N-acetylglucosaminyl deacetylase|uniref:PIG-L deacetylase family protein n=1 Tax=Tuberibacillus calidus TaxID=340097 RepID=UPI000403E874|nr:PIG-L family deacetylase [Tuberibacillus calidus]
MSDKKHLMVIDAHCGDGELQVGAIAAKYAKAGHKVTFLHLTAGEKGNPPHLSVEEYREQKIRESEEACAILGAECITLDYKDAELRLTEEIVTHLATLLRKYRPNLVLTHWINSIHSDHATVPKIVEAAQLKTGLSGFDLGGLKPHYYGYLHSENWEDMEGYVPDIFVDVTETFDLYLEAISKFWFVMNSKDFRYFDYYKALGTVRGCQNRTRYAQTLKFPVGGNIRKGTEIPGFPL